MVRLQDYTTTEITIDQVEPVISVLADIGDQLIGPEGANSGMFDLGVDVQIGRVIWQLLKRVESQRRFEILRAAFQRGRAVSVIQKALIVLGQQQGLYGERASPPEEWFITAEQLVELDGVFVERIRQSSRDGSLLSTPELLAVLAFWREKASEVEVRKWVTQILEDDRRLAHFLEKCLHSSSSVGFGDSVGRKHDRLDPNWLKSYCDVDQIVDRARIFRENQQLTDRQSRAVNQLVKEYDFRKRGGNPNSPFVQDEIE
jgi:predicted KAP-like P-loop ATPase